MNIEVAKQPSKLMDKLVDVRKLLGVEKISTQGEWRSTDAIHMNLLTDIRIKMVLFNKNLGKRQ